MGIKSTRKLKMMFTTADDNQHNITLNYAKEGLKDGDGAALVKTAMNTIADRQPLVVNITKQNGAQVIETTTTDVDFD